MARLPKIECSACGRKHCVRREAVGVCARCSQRELETSQGWSSDLFLASIENAGSKGSYSSYLHKVARLLGAASHRELDWSQVTESVVVAVAQELGKKLASSVASAFRSLRDFFLATMTAPSTGCYFVPPTKTEELTEGIVQVGSSLFFKANLKPARTTLAVPVRELDAFEATYLA